MIGCSTDLFATNQFGPCDSQGTNDVTPLTYPPDILTIVSIEMYMNLQ